MMHSSTEIARRAAEFEALFDADVNAIVVIDADGTVRRFSRAAERLFGYASSEVIGFSVGRLMTPADWKWHSANMKRYLETREPRVIGIGREVTAVHADGHHLPVEVAVGEVNTEGAIRFVVVVRDLSERYRLEAQLARQREALAQVSRMTMAGELTAALAHEMNQPLSAIATFAGASRRLLPSADQLGDSCAEDARRKLSDIAQSMRQIEEQALRASEVVVRMRDFIRDRQSLRKTTRYQHLIGQIMPIANLYARTNGVWIDVQFDTGDIDVDVDSVQIQQVVLNLLRNAVDATESGDEGPGKPVRLRIAQLADSRVRTQVIDTGSGIDETIAQSLFSPFTTSKPEGLGMGLSISQSIMHAHDSEIRFETSRTGSRFWFDMALTEG